MNDYLKEKRKKRNMTMRDVGEKANISESYYSLIERGKRNPSPKTAKQIANVLGFKWTKFYEK